MKIKTARLVEKLLLIGVILSALVMIFFGLITHKMGIGDDDTIRTVGNSAIVALLACWMGWRKIHSDRIRDETPEAISSDELPIEDAPPQNDQEID